MKLIPAIICCAALLAGCKKDINACKTYTEIPAPGYLDASGLPAPELRDTLSKYPQLRLADFRSDTWGWSGTCDIYYNDLIVFGERYYLTWSSLNKTFSSNSFYKGSFLFSFSPGISHEAAIKEAKKYVDLDHTCISYRLGLFNESYNPDIKNYRLAWRIEGKGGAPFVLINAENGNMLRGSYGIVY